MILIDGPVYAACESLSSVSMTVCPFAKLYFINNSSYPVMCINGSSLLRFGTQKDFVYEMLLLQSVFCLLHYIFLNFLFYLPANFTDKRINHFLTEIDLGKNPTDHTFSCGLLFSFLECCNSSSKVHSTEIKQSVTCTQNRASWCSVHDTKAF